MAEGIVYLDVDDEITSAASRIRSSPGTKVALVIPYGSRIATSRMNFRLLSREAVVSNRRLSIVSGDAAARSLAASAGLPVFGTVGEYETSVGGSVGGDGEGSDGVERPSAPVTGAEERFDEAPTSETIVAPVVDREPPAAPSRKTQLPRRPAPSSGATALGLGAAVAGAGSASATALPADGPVDAPSPDEPAVWPGLPSILPRGVRTPVLAVAGLAALALVVLAVAGYLLLPSAAIAIAPLRAPIGPLPLTISADPDATAVDPVGLVVPAVRVDVPVEASRSFDTTGRHVEETPARGSVTFENYNFLGSDTVPAGSIVSTEGGTKFRTLASVTLPPGDLVLPNVIPSRRTVNVEAVKDGPGGNVPANAIRVVPPGENPESLKVNNPDPTTGGSHTETPQISKAEVDKAVASLEADVRRSFENAVATGDGAPEGTTVFPDTALLGPITAEVDPATLVGKRVASFDLRLTATGTVIAVDPSPVREIAEAQLASHVTAGREIVPGSTDIEVGEGLVGEDGQVSFLATASAEEVTVVDADALREVVKGKTAAEATAALAPFGRATVVLWPDWVSTITGVDSRLTITVEAPEAGAGPSAQPSSSSGLRPSRAGSPSVRPSTAPDSSASAP